MSTLHIRLFGKLSIDAGEAAASFDNCPRKALELLSYLLLNYAQPLSREHLATLFWGDSSTAQARRALRQTLWQLQSAVIARLAGVAGVAKNAIFADNEWVQAKVGDDLWLDVAQFERAIPLTQTPSNAILDAEQAKTLREGVALYRGNLLEGCYQDWCIYERERLQSAYISMLDRLILHSERQTDYQAGIGYASQILRYERGRERTHRHLMRLYYLANDRATALRQYQRCVVALREELDVEPAESTCLLYEQIKADRLEVMSHTAPLAEQVAPVNSMLSRLRQLAVSLEAIQHQVRDEIRVLEQYHR